MTRTQIQFPDPLYQRLKTIAEQRDWSLAEVMRKAAEHFVLKWMPSINVPAHDPLRRHQPFPPL